MSEKCRRCGMPLPDDCILRHDSPNRCLALVMAQADALELIKDKAKDLGSEFTFFYVAISSDIKLKNALTDMAQMVNALLAAIEKLEGET